MKNSLLLLLTFVGIIQKGPGFLFHALPFLAVGACLFCFRGMGSGDGKLMAVIGGYLGIEAGFYAVAAGFLVGAVWSLWKMRCPGLMAERFRYLKTYVKHVIAEGKIQPYDSLGEPHAAHHIPFAVCLASGVFGYVICLWQGIL